MTTGTRETLLANKPKLSEIVINGITYYLREYTVGEMNKVLFGQQQEMIKIAKAQGIELNLDDETELTKQLMQVYDPYRLSRSLATRLCDEKGNNLFDAENPDDLTALSQLDKAVLEQLNKKLAENEPKNLTPDANFK